MHFCIFKNEFYNLELLLLHTKIVNFLKNTLQLKILNKNKSLWKTILDFNKNQFEETGCYGLIHFSLIN